MPGPEILPVSSEKQSREALKSIEEGRPHFFLATRFAGLLHVGNGIEFEVVVGTLIGLKRVGFNIVVP